MAKRFIDDQIFLDSWFTELSQEAKLAWIYCIVTCNHAGILEIVDKWFKVATGIDDGWDAVKAELSSRLIEVLPNIYFIEKFFWFQYPNYPKKQNNATNSAIAILYKYGLVGDDGEVIISNASKVENYPLSFERADPDLTDALRNAKKALPPEELINTKNVKSKSTDGGHLTVGRSRDISISKGKGKGKGESVRGVCLMKNSGVTISDIREAFLRADDLRGADPAHYFNAALDWSDSKNEMRKDWIATARSFARRDIRDGKLKLSMHRSSGGTNVAPREHRPTEINDKLITPMPDSLKKKFGID